MVCGFVLSAAWRSPRFPLTVILGLLSDLVGEVGV